MAADQHRITLDAALDLVNRAREQKLLSVSGWSVDRGIVDEILAQNDVQSLRFYLAITADGAPTLVLVGVTSAGQDIHRGVIAEYVLPCPPICDPDSPFAVSRGA
jgi:hypothetical protein